MNKKAGVLYPIFSLPGKYGIGSFGAEARQAADGLAKAGFSVWQVLPLTPTGYGDSPYQSECGYAGNPYFIDLETLKHDGLLTAEELKSAERPNARYIDYGDLYRTRFALLYKAYERFEKGAAFAEFSKKPGLFDYALYVAIKKENGSRPWYEWAEPYRLREPSALAQFAFSHEKEIGFYLFLQYEFDLQWNALKSYVNGKGILILGDLPLYLSRDSVEVWTKPELFQLNGDGTPTSVAGVPPDYFSKTGQLWGNPLYDWEAQKKDGYAWWQERIRSNLRLYDMLRIDHFRGIDRYWSVPFGEETAVNGAWKEGPKTALFAGFENAPIVAEDLGASDESLLKFLKEAGYPGMRVTSFMFGGDVDNPHLPSNFVEKSVVYTGTHDNQPFSELLKEESGEALNRTVEILQKEGALLGVEVQKAQTAEYYTEKMCEILLRSRADLAILPFFDLLPEKTGLRVNEPGDSSGKNWTVRLLEGELSEKRLCAFGELPKTRGNN